MQFTFGRIGDDKDVFAETYIQHYAKNCPLCGQEGIVTVAAWAERYIATFNCLRQFNDGFHNLQIGCEGSSPTAARAGLEDEVIEYTKRMRGIDHE